MPEATEFSRQENENILHMLKKVEENVKTMKGEMGDTKKVQLKLLEVKNIIFEMKNIPHGIKSKSDNADEKIEEFKT